MVFLERYGLVLSRHSPDAWCTVVKKNVVLGESQITDNVEQRRCRHVGLPGDLSETYEVKERCRLEMDTHSAARYAVGERPSVDSSKDFWLLSSGTSSTFSLSSGALSCCGSDLVDRTLLRCLCSPRRPADSGIGLME